MKDVLYRRRIILLYLPLSVNSLPSCDFRRQARAWYLKHWTYLFNHSSSVGVLRSYSGSICWWWTSVSGPESPSIHLGDREGQNESAFRTFFCTSSRPLTSIGNIQQGFDVGQDLKLRIKLTCFSHQTWHQTWHRISMISPYHLPFNFNWHLPWMPCYYRSFLFPIIRGHSGKILLSPIPPSMLHMHVSLASLLAINLRVVVVRPQGTTPSIPLVTDHRDR